MRFHFPYLSSILDDGQLVWGSRGVYKCSLGLSLALILFSLPPSTFAFNPSFSAGTQCSPFGVTWTWSNTTDGPPFVLLILPFDDQPTILELPNSTFDAATNTGSYTLDKLPLRSGAQYITSMQYGDGAHFSCSIRFQSAHPTLMVSILTIDRNNGGVSLVQTVGHSSDSSCLTNDVSSTSSFFTLDPAVPPQCSFQKISWNHTRYPEPPDIRGFIPGGNTFRFNRSNTTWEVIFQEGTQMVLLAQPAALINDTSEDSNARTSRLITVTNSKDNACLHADSPRSTVSVALPTAASITPTAASITPTAASITSTADSTTPARNDK